MDHQQPCPLPVDQDDGDTVGCVHESDVLEAPFLATNRPRYTLGYTRLDLARVCSIISTTQIVKSRLVGSDLTVVRPLVCVI